MSKQNSPSIKVALIDNMNNNFFSIARYLRDQGLDAHLFSLKNSYAHFDPQADSFDDTTKMSWLHELSRAYDAKDWLIGGYAEDLQFLNDYDVIVACGMTLAFLHKAKIPIDIIVPYGSDLYMAPFVCFSGPRLKRGVFDLLTRRAHHQKSAFKAATYICSSNSLPLFDEAVNKLGLKALNLGIPMLYNKLDFNQDVDGIWGFLDKHDFVVFNHARQLWRTDVDGLKDFKKFGGYKRNDRMIEGFAQFISKTHFKNPILIMFDYGPDVSASKALIQELKIEGNVVFMPLMERKYIMSGLSLADFGSGSFRENLCGIGGTTYEVLASGTPTITHTNGQLTNTNSFYYQAPILDACSSNQICKIFEEFEADPNKYHQIGKASKEWFNANLGEGLAAKYVKLIVEAAENKKTDIAKGANIAAKHT